MAQNKLFDPIVNSGPTLTGTGNGTLTVDNLTHFTTTQSYTATCIATSPSTLFSVVGSLDGPVGIATVGTQFYDSDLKVFLTIQAGPTAFIVGDQFTFGVTHGTDLSQDNIDDYDELPQKNFGSGNRGTNTGDHNIRIDTAIGVATLAKQDLKYTSVATGQSGNLVSVEYLAPYAGVKSSAVIQDLTYTAQTAGVAGDLINVIYNDFQPATKATRTIQNVNYEAQTAGTIGNGISLEYINGGSLSVSVSLNKITVTIVSGSTTASAIVAAVNGDVSASALVFAKVTPILAGANTQTAPVAEIFLTGGAAAVGLAGAEVVQVTGNNIVVYMQSGVSTANQIKAAVIASIPANALVSVSGSSASAQTLTASPTFLAGGIDPSGLAGDEEVTVVGNAISIRFEPGKSTATQIVTAFNASAPALALASISVIGVAANPQIGPSAAAFLDGGVDKRFLLNKEELTDSGSFFAGNADLKAKNLVLAKDVTAAGNVKVGGKLQAGLVSDVELHVNKLAQDNKTFLRTSDYSKVTWSKPDLSFESDLVIEFADTNFSNTVAVINSPIEIADGQNLYVILNRLANSSLTPIVASTVPALVDAYRIATRRGDNLVMHDNTLVRDGKSVAIGEGGGSGGSTRADLYDPVSTSLPSGVSAVIDGVTVTDGQLVLFTNLSVNNNRIYKVSGVGVALVWTAQSSFPNGLLPLTGDQVVINLGTNFGLQQGVFDGTVFKFNDVVRFFSGTDYWEISSLKTSSLPAATTGNLITINSVGSENLIVDYSIIRGSSKQVGSLKVTTNGIVATVADSSAKIGTLGVDFDADVSSGNLRVRYTTSAGSPSTIKYYVSRWSDQAGGPAGIPNYSTSFVGVGAAGADTQIQFNDAGNLGADSDFAWDKTSKQLSLENLTFKGVGPDVTLLDNTTNGTAISFSLTSANHFMIEYSLTRDGAIETGLIILAHDGTVSNMAYYNVNVGVLGITFDSIVSGPNVLVRYTSTNTGFNGAFKYSVRKWL